MRVEAVELVHVRMPLVDAFATAHGTQRDKEAVLVHVVTDAGEGWGECAAQRDAGYASETLDDAHRNLRDELIPRVFDDADAVGRVPVSFARAGLEFALADASLRADGKSLADALGVTRTEIVAGVTVGLGDDDEVRAAVARAVGAGYRRVKCKVVPGRAAAIVAAAHAAIDGAPVELAIDANGSFDAGDRDELIALDRAGLQCIEQPFPRDRLDAHAALAAGIETRVCLDESVTDAEAAQRARDVGACDVVSAKPSRLGWHETRRVLALGVPTLAGGMLETGIGRAVLVSVAAACDLVGDCAASTHYFGPAGDITEPFVLVDGRLAVPAGPGVGVVPDPEQLERVTVARERFTRKGR